MSSLVNIPMFLFGGFFSNSKAIGAWIRWFQYVTPIRYAFEAAIRNEYENKDLSQYQVNPMTMLGFNLGIGKSLGLLVVLIVGFRLLSIICLKLLVSKFQ